MGLSIGSVVWNTNCLAKLDFSGFSVDCGQRVIVYNDTLCSWVVSVYGSIIGSVSLAFDFFFYPVVFGLPYHKVLI